MVILLLAKEQNDDPKMNAHDAVCAVCTTGTWGLNSGNCANCATVDDALAASGSGDTAVAGATYTCTTAIFEWDLYHDDAPRAATVKVNERGSAGLWRLDRLTFKKILVNNHTLEVDQRVNYLSQVSLLSELSVQFSIRFVQLF